MQDLAPVITEYLKNLAKAANAPGVAPELSLRPSLDKLLQDVIKILQRSSQFHLVNEGTTPGVRADLYTQIRGRTVVFDSRDQVWRATIAPERIACPAFPADAQAVDAIRAA